MLLVIDITFHSTHGEAPTALARLPQSRFPKASFLSPHEWPWVTNRPGHTALPRSVRFSPQAVLLGKQSLGQPPHPARQSRFRAGPWTLRARLGRKTPPEDSTSQKLSRADSDGREESQPLSAQGKGAGWQAPVYSAKWEIPACGNSLWLKSAPKGWQVLA